MGDWLNRLEIAEDVMRRVLDEMPASREISLAKTKLDECVLWGREFMRKQEAPED